MSVTIDSLDIQIRSSAGSAAKNIGELADALGNLNANAKVTKIVNSLERLNGALTNMKSQQSVMSHLSALTKSLSSLAAIPQLTGLRSAINELKKLPGVMQSLDTAEISQFTAKMKLLASGLGPLATQIDKIGKGFSKLPLQVSKCVTAVKRLDSANKSAASSAKKHGEAVNNQSFNLLAAYENLSNVFGMIHGIQDAISKVMNDAIQWDGIQFRFGRAFGEDAEMVLEYAEKVSKELRINQQMFMQYSSLYGSLLSGFGMEQEKITTISVGLTELSYDIWAAYNDRYKTLEDASEAIRSAITGEIEPIRNAGIALTEASLQEYVDTYTNLGMSVENMTEAQKSELRYAVMVNAAMQQGIVGTYAREMQTAEGAVRTLSQQLKTLGQALGSLFLPILQKVVPWVTAFVELLTEGLIALGAMFGINFQEIQWGDASGMKQTAEGANATADALGDAAKNAKKMKDYALGFDELNVISPPSDSSAGGGGGSLGLDLDTLWDESVFASASKQIDELKQKIKDLYDEWRWQIEAFGAGTMLMALGNIIEKLKDAEIFSGKFLKNMNTISKIGLSAVVITLQWTLMDEALENFIEEGSWENYIKAAAVAALGTWALGAQWGPTGVVIGLGITAAVSLKATFADGSVDSIEEVTTGLTGLATAVAAIGVVLKKTDLGAALKLLFSGAKFSEVFAAWFPKLATVISTATGWVTGTLVPGILSALGTLASALGISVGAAAAAVAAVIVAAILAVVYWDEIKVFFTETLPAWFSDTGTKIGAAFSSVTQKIGEFFANAGDVVKEIWGNVANWFNEHVVQPIGDFFSPIVDWFAKWFDSIWQTVSDVFYNIGVIAGGCWEIIVAVWKVVSTWFKSNVTEPVLKFFETTWSNVKKFALSAWDGIKSVFSSISSWINDKVIKPVTNFFSKMWSGFVDKAKVAWDGVKSVFSKVANFFGDIFSAAWKKVVNVFSVAGEIFVDIKDGILSGFKVVVNGIIRGINKVVAVPFNGINTALKFVRDITILGLTPFANLKTISVPEIPLLASGGFVGSGQMFIAREAGPELVGSIGNRTAVANNDQIIEGIAAGVYEAVVAAMNAASGNNAQSINVYLDGKQITAAVERRQSERGRSLMGNQLGYV